MDIEKDLELAEDHLYQDVIFPSLLVRVKALFVDLLIVLLIFSVTSVLMGKFNGIPDWLRGLIFVFSVYIYEPLFISLFGGTIGHNILGINIRKVDKPNEKVNIFQSAIRSIVKYSLGIISFLTVTSNDRMRSIHDQASGGIVLYKKVDEGMK